MALKSLVGNMVELFGRAADKLGCDRAARARLLSLGDAGGMLAFLHNKKMIREKKKESIAKKTMKMREEEEEEEVWRRTIMMGEKCQPLEFSGVYIMSPTASGRPLPLALLFEEIFRNLHCNVSDSLFSSSRRQLRELRLII